MSYTSSSTQDYTAKGKGEAAKTLIFVADERTNAIIMLASEIDTLRIKKLIAMVEEGTVFEREEPIKWKCSVCGYIHEATTPPVKCPSCEHPQRYYEPAYLDV